jgi:hypothetical protein
MIGPTGIRAGRQMTDFVAARIGPLGFALLLLVLALFGGVFLLALIGAVLIWFPVLLVLALIAAIAGLIRRL